MWVFAGLGNPGSQYARNRHNIGFMAVEEIARRYGFAGWKSSKFKGEIAEGQIAGQRVIAVKPATFMNLSGDCIGPLLRFYKIPVDHLIVFHDELELTAGKLRVKKGGGHAGHNGLKSLDAHCTPDYWRVRLGIGHPGSKERVTGHVLGDFSAADQDWLTPFLDAVAAAAPLLLTETEVAFMNRVATLLQPPKPGKPAP